MTTSSYISDLLMKSDELKELNDDGRVIIASCGTVGGWVIGWVADRVGESKSGW